MFRNIIDGKKTLEALNSELSAASLSEGNFGGMAQFEESYLEYIEREKLKDLKKLDEETKAKFEELS